jgi:hypothetical protein
MVSISVQNNINDSFYASHGRIASLLIHPHGLKLLQYYAGMKGCDPNSKPLSDDEDDTVLANALSTALA